MGGQPAADGTGPLGSEVERNVLLALVEKAKLVTLLEVDDSQDLGDGLADIVTNCELCQLFDLNMYPEICLNQQMCISTYILVSLEALPPVIF